MQPTDVVTDSPIQEARSRIVLVLVIVGVACAVLGGVMAGRVLAKPFFEPAEQVPGTISMTLDEGTYLVFERRGSNRSYGPVTVSNRDAVRVDPGDVSVVGPAGPLDTSWASVSETLTAARPSTPEWSSSRFPTEGPTRSRSPALRAK